MSDVRSSPTDPIELFPSRPTSTAERVARRRKLLELWLEKGVPSGQMPLLPRSLRQAAQWKDESLGIEPIKSPNQFVTSHPQWGKDVMAIGDMLEHLIRRAGAPSQPKKSATATNDDLKQKRDELRQVLLQVGIQWLNERDRATNALTLLAECEEKLADLMQKVAKGSVDSESGRTRPSTVTPFPGKRT